MSSTVGRIINEVSIIVISDQVGRVDMQVYTRIHVCHSVLIDFRYMSGERQHYLMYNGSLATLYQAKRYRARALNFIDVAQ